MATETKPITITKTERASLRRILKEREELLQRQLAVRLNDIEKAVEDKIEEEFADRIEKAQKKAKALQAQVKAFKEELKEEGLELEKYDWTVEPRNTYSHVQRKVREIQSAHGLADLNLREEFLTLREELEVGVLEGEDAKAFLDKVPTVDSLLPLPEGGVQGLLTE